MDCYLRKRKIIIDVGATHIRVGIAPGSSSHPLLDILTPKTQKSIIKAICQSIQQICNQYTIWPTNILICCPGLVDRTGVIHKALYLPLTGCHLQAEILKIMKIPTMVTNDAKAQALGCVQGDESISYIVIGTGIGGAIVEHGSLIFGKQGFAGEIGHIPLTSFQKLCVCGQIGCIDVTASGWAITKLLGPEWWLRNLNHEEKNVIRSAGVYIGTAASLCAILHDSDLIVIAGKTIANKVFKDGILEAWNRKNWSQAKIIFYSDTWQLAWRGLLKMQENNIKI